MKRYWSISLQVLVVLSLIFLAACGSNNNAGNSGSSNTDAGSSNSGGASADPVKIGAILTLSGNFAPFGQGAKEGLELYFEMHGNKIGDRPVEIIVEDDKGDPNGALQKYQQVVLNDKVDFIVSGATASIANAMTDKVNSDKTVPMINVVGSANNLAWAGKSDYVVRTFGSGWQFASVLAKHAMDSVGKTAVAIATDYAAGHDQVKDFNALFQESGGEVLETIWVPQGTSDFSSYLSQINQAKPDSVFMFIPGADGPRFIDQFKQFGLSAQILDAGAVVVSPATANAIKDAIVGTRGTIPYSPEIENDLNTEFLEAFKAKYNKVPDLYAVSGYDAAHIISQTIQEAGSTDVEDIANVFKKGLSFDSPRGPMSIDPATNTPIQNMYILEGTNEGGQVGLKLIETFENVQMPANDPGYPQPK